VIGGVLAAVEAHLGSRQVARVLYGSIIGLALVLTLEFHPPDDGTVVGSIIATAIAVGLAEFYSEVVGTETRLRRRVTRADLAHMVDDVVAVIFGVSFPTVFFIAAALGVIASETAFDLARWSGLGLIGGYGFFAARLAGSGVVRSLLNALLVVVLGALLIIAKALVH
jgi:hypothetical protein